jgi:hypothetical protein
MRLDAIVSNPSFASLPAATQIQVIHKTISQSRETARTMIMMQNPSIIQQAMQAKLSALHK